LLTAARAAYVRGHPKLAEFSDDIVRDGPVPFMVRRRGNDVLVSAKNTENVFEVGGLSKSTAIPALPFG